MIDGHCHVNTDGLMDATMESQIARMMYLLLQPMISVIIRLSPVSYDVKLSQRAFALLCEIFAPYHTIRTAFHYEQE